MAKRSSGSGWDDDEDDEPDEPDDRDGWEAFTLPESWEAWWDFDWDSYDGDVEEYALSADYGGTEQ